MLCNEGMTTSVTTMVLCEKLLVGFKEALSVAQAMAQANQECQAEFYNRMLKVCCITEGDRVLIANK